MITRMLTLLLAVLLTGPGLAVAVENEHTTETASSDIKKSKNYTEGLPYCPICGPEDDNHGISLGFRYKGKKYKFCSMGCLRAFKADPDKYLSEDYEAHGHVEEGLDGHEGDGHDH